MIRVIIADDEARVCKLINKLIDWDKLGMRIVGTASNGIEALELIEKENPDIVITDIRMPGYDGLEMIEKAKMINNDLEIIIISGYGQFEYAKKAIEFGVKDYLLKPVNQDELLKALTKAGKYVQKKKGQISLEKEYKMILKNDVSKIRESFLSNLILFNSESFKDCTLSEVNKNYHFNFQEGIFSIVALKIDYSGKDYSDRIKSIINEAAGVIESELQEITYELDFINNKSNLYIVINYSQNYKKQIEAVFIKLLEYFKRRISAAEKIEITIALGEDSDDLRNISESFKSAVLLIEDRILKGTGRIIKTNVLTTDEAETEYVFDNFSKKLIKVVEVLDLDKAKKIIFNFKNEISSKNIRGAELRKMINEIGNIYLNFAL